MNTSSMVGKGFAMGQIRIFGPPTKYEAPKVQLANESVRDFVKKGKTDVQKIKPEKPDPRLNQ